MNQVPVDLLKPHPKNKEYFPEGLPEPLWSELVEDIKENGIINPLVVALDYTVLAGHLRLEAAKHVGLTHVPVVIRDVDPESDEAVALLIKDNLLRRQLNDMQVARLVRMLKEKYGLKRGNNQYSGSGCDKLSQAVGLNKRKLERLDKLNDLIPELQTLVESGKLNVTAAYELAFLSSETQEQLLVALGESITELKQSEAKELRRKIEAEVRAEAERRAAELQRSLEALKAEKRQVEVLWENRERELTRTIADLQSALRESGDRLETERLRRELEETREKLQHERAEARRQIDALKRQLDEMSSKQSEVKEKVVEVVPQKVLNELQKLRKERDAYRERLRELNEREEILRETVEGQAKKLEEDAAFFVSRVRAFLKETSLLAYTAREIYRCRPEIQREYDSAVRSVLKWAEDTLTTMGGSVKAIDVEVV
ncbi:ParB/RepB/Spo0J family partition protein [Desulfofundulus thermosubterraneus]|uniref:Chromosome partitioning protein, ParB family n=1 Tax=Desulfofundulus thermosubterraneus DSM 16057 TaxID=1121432 RepID=A0A1M6H0W2_9FIRM|nr:ParB N-terminal domain-containing protein [Desulfofundulus thermosubterraneus]SHJ15782.1 chromosome partitioning protein, ParB family [Desulfofundulus thermosubterraneus DSM 16057]